MHKVRMYIYVNGHPQSLDRTDGLISGLVFLCMDGIQLLCSLAVELGSTDQYACGSSVGRASA